MRGCKNTSSISANDFYTHFKDLFTSEQLFEDEGTESQFQTEIPETVVHQLDCKFSQSEVLKAIVLKARQKHRRRSIIA